MNKTTRRKICKLFKNWFGYKLEQNGKCTKICDMLQELPLLEIFEYEEGFSVMTEKEYGIYDEILFDMNMNNHFIMYARDGRKIIEWELDVLEGVVYRKEM